MDWWWNVWSLLKGLGLETQNTSLPQDLHLTVNRREFSCHIEFNSENAVVYISRCLFEFNLWTFQLGHQYSQITQGPDYLCVVGTFTFCLVIQRNFIFHPNSPLRETSRFLEGNNQATIRIRGPVQQLCNKTLSIPSESIILPFSSFLCYCMIMKRVFVFLCKIATQDNEWCWYKWKVVCLVII